MGRPIEYDDSQALRMMAERIVRGLARGRAGGAWAAAKMVARLMPGYSDDATVKRLRTAYLEQRGRLEEEAKGAWEERKRAYLADPLKPLRSFAGAVKTLAAAATVPSRKVLELLSGEQQAQIPLALLAPLAPWFPPPDGPEGAERWAIILPPEGPTLLRPLPDPRVTRAAADLRQLASTAVHYATLLEVMRPGRWPPAWPRAMEDDAAKVLAAARQHVRRRPRS